MNAIREYIYQDNITLHLPKRNEETLPIQTTFTPEIRILGMVNIKYDTQ